MMSRGGWTSRTIKAGDVVTVIVAPLRDGRPGGLVLEVTCPTGARCCPACRTRRTTGARRERRGRRPCSPPHGSRRSAAPAAAQPDFTGAWERYPSPGESSIRAMRGPRSPTPPLKPWLAEWQAHEASSRRGSPRASRRRQLRQVPARRHAGDDAGHVPDGDLPAARADQHHPGSVQPDAPHLHGRARCRSANELDPTFYGRSVARWEGDTLVIETTGIKQHVRSAGRRIPKA